ncbi:MAG: hypothetical protein R2698_00875 [Microthrixaceae bacterium]
MSNTQPPGSRRRRHGRALIGAAALALVPLSLPACGSNVTASTTQGSTASKGANSSSGNSSSESGASAADMKAYADCLAKNGVTMPARPTLGRLRRSVRRIVLGQR